MNFIFSNPGLLWGLLALAIPVAIHLLLRRKPNVEHWGATRFLKTVIERRRSQLQMQSLSQLLVRVGMIGILVLAVADPRFDAGSPGTAGPPQVHRLLIIDVSMSMSADVEGESRLAEVRRQIRDLIAESSMGDSWQVLLHGTHVEPVRFRIPTYEPEFVIEEVSELRPSFEGANLTETLQRALSLADEFPGNQNEVLFWTDMAARDVQFRESQAYEVNALLEQLSRMANVSVIDVGQRTVPNLALTQVQSKSNSVSVGEVAQIEASVTNYSSSTQQVAVRAFIGSEAIAEKVVAVDSYKTATVGFDLLFTQPGLAKCEMRIDQDSLLADNQRSFVVDVRSPVQVLIVEENSPSRDLRQSDFLQLALNVSTVENSEGGIVHQPKYVVTLLSPNTFREASLAEFDVLLICGLSKITEFDALRIAQFVNQGGGVLFSMSDSISLTQYNQQLGPEGNGLIPVRLLRREKMDAENPVPFQVEQVKRDHPITEPFEFHPEAGLSTTRIYSYVSTEEFPAGQGICLLSLKPNMPLMGVQQFGLGTVYLVTTAFNTDWGSWVLWPSFLPLIQRIIDNLAQRDDLIVHKVVGQEVSHQIRNPEQIRVIHDPGGRVVWEKNFGVHSVQEMLDSYLEFPGNYTCEADEPGKVIHILQVQPDVSESDLRHVAASQFLSSAAMKGLAIDLYDDAAKIALSRQGIQSAQKSYVARWLALLTGLLLLVDQLFAYRSGLAFGALCGIVLSGLVSTTSEYSPQLKVILILGCTLLCAYLGASITSMDTAKSTKSSGMLRKNRSGSVLE